MFNRNRPSFLPSLLPSTTMSDDEEQDFARNRRASFGAREIDIAAKDFSLYFKAGSTEFTALRAAAIKGELRHSKVRSISWKLFLGVLPSDEPPEAWQGALDEKRRKYAELMQEYKTDPTQAEDDDPLSAMSDPLSQGEDTPWQKYYAEQELLKEIEKDMERLYPEGCDNFFEDANVRSYMSNVLFLWSRMHPETSYRQGMHEILAPLVFQMEWDCLKDDAAGSGGEFDSLIRSLLDTENIEADAFWCFVTIMDDMESMFAVKSQDFKALARQRQQERALGKMNQRRVRRSNSEVANEKIAAVENDPTLTPVLRSCNRIHHQLLHKADPELHKRLAGMDIEPQLYAMAWVRLMFGRQFHIEDVMCLWDGIFAAQSSVGGTSPSASEREDKIVEIVEYVGVAMVIFVREFLMSQDESYRCLQRLMKYPPVEDVMVLLDRGLEIRADPAKVYAPKPRAVVAAPAAQPQRRARAAPTARSFAVGKVKGIVSNVVEKVGAVADEALSFKDIFGDMKSTMTRSSGTDSARGPPPAAAAPAAPAPIVPVPQKSTKRTASPTLSRKPFPTLKLVYFDIPGKGEPIRLALTYLGIPFEDYRVKDRAEFHSMRDSGELMFGQLPALFVNGKVLNQSAAILRFIGRLALDYGTSNQLYPSNMIRGARVDAVMDQEADAFAGLRVSKYKERFGFSPSFFTEEVAQELQKTINSEIIPRHFRSLEKILVEGGTGWMAGTNGPSIADFFWAPSLKACQTGWTGDSTVLSGFPKLEEFMGRFYGIPQVKNYYYERDQGDSI